jgi:hypothetical protein
MKYNKIFKAFALSLSILTITTFSACKRNQDNDNESQQKVAVDNAQAESEFDGVVDISQQAMDNSAVQARAASTSQEKAPVPFPAGGSCATIDVTTPAGQPNVRNVVIDFGTQGCEGPDGRTRKGKILINFVRPLNASANFNPLNAPNLITTITFDNFFVNNIKVEGTKKITCQSFTAATPNNPILVRRHRIEVMNGKLTFPDATTHTWNTDRYRVVSVNPTVLGGARVRVWGQYNGVNRNNIAYSGVVSETQALIWKTSCPLFVRRPVAGILTLNATNRPTAILNFGEETCDNTFTITINGNTYTIN